jgi:hypothetical protein
VEFLFFIGLVSHRPGDTNYPEAAAQQEEPDKDDAGS